MAHNSLSVAIATDQSS